MYPGRRQRLKRALDELSRRTDFNAGIAGDPIAFPRRFKHPLDIEVMGWLATGLAYGRVPLFQAALEKILKVMGHRPYQYALHFDPRKDTEAFLPLYYRMNEGKDIACFIYFIRQILERHGSIGNLFASQYREDDEDIGAALERFIATVQDLDTEPVYGRKIHPPGLARFFSRPSKGSSCKRLNLYLRWMVRPDDGLDFGLWKAIPPSKLIIPLDTHILRISRYLGLTRRKTSGWVTAKAITEILKEIDPADPLRYDFPLCHHGISGDCPIGRAPKKCEACPLLGECAKGRMLVC